MSTFFSQILGLAIAAQLPSPHCTSLSHIHTAPHRDLANVTGTVKSRPFTPFPTGSYSLGVASKVAFYFSLFWYTQSLPVCCGSWESVSILQVIFCVLTMSQALAAPGLGDLSVTQYVPQPSPPLSPLPCHASWHCTPRCSFPGSFQGVCPLAIQPRCSCLPGL